MSVLRANTVPGVHCYEMEFVTEPPFPGATPDLIDLRVEGYRGLELGGQDVIDATHKEEAQNILRMDVWVLLQIQ